MIFIQFALQVIEVARLVTLCRTYPAVARPCTAPHAGYDLSASERSRSGVPAVHS